MMRRRRCLMVALVVFTLHATLAYVAPFQPSHEQRTASVSAMIPKMFSSSATEKSWVNHEEDNAVLEPISRQTRIVSPLSLILATLTGSSSAAEAATKPADRGTQKQQQQTASSSSFETAIRTYFPGAQPSSVVANRVVTALRHRNYTPTNTLLGSSVCSDEINQTPTSMVPSLERALSSSGAFGIPARGSRRGTFQLGGLGGLPFVGTSGMTAFYHHTPHLHQQQKQKVGGTSLAADTSTTTTGKLVILFGPHVGISESGELGKIVRPGMQEETASCGAATAAYQAISQEASRTKGSIATTRGENGSHFDFQEEYIIDNLKKKLATLAGKEAKGGDETIAFVTKKMYELVWDLIKLEIDAVTAKDDFWTDVSEITLLGGIIINRNAKSGEDYFQPLTMKYVNLKGEQTIFDDVFGNKETRST